MKQWLARSAAIAIAVGLLAGCAGPQKPLIVGMKNYPTDVVMGGPRLEPVATPPLPPIVIQSPELPPFGEHTPVPPVQFSPCPAADTAKPPTKRPVLSFATPPAEATYAYRTDGEIQRSGANPGVTELPPISTRSIQHVKVDKQGTQTFDVVATLDAAVTTTSYEVIPHQATPPALGGLAYGVYVTKIVAVQGTATDTFTPNPPMLLSPDPLFGSAGWSVNSRDDATHRLVNYSGAFGKETKIDACGTWIKVVMVHLNGDILAGPCIASPPVPKTCGPGVGGQLDPSTRRIGSFQADYAFSGTYGAFSLFDHVESNSDANGDGIYTTLTATINKEPAEVQRATDV